MGGLDPSSQSACWAPLDVVCCPRRLLLVVSYKIEVLNYWLALKAVPSQNGGFQDLPNLALQCNRLIVNYV